MTARARTGNQTETGAGRAARRGRPDTPAPRAPSQCPVEQWLAFLGHRWNALLLWHLSAGPRRSFPKAVSYALTARGSSLVFALGSIEAWARDAAPDAAALPWT